MTTAVETAHTRTGWGKDSVDLSSAQRDGYRARVDELAEAALRSGDRRAAAETVRRAAHDPVLQMVLDAHPDGAEVLAARLADEVERYAPNDRTAATDLGAQVRILLLHQIDAAWWGGVEPYRDAESIRTCPELVDLRRLRSRGQVSFRFRVQTSSLPVRAWRSAQRRVAPGSTPATAGLSFAAARPELVALAEGVTREFTERVGRGSAAARAGVWVNSAVRSIEHQRHLRSLGYSALEPSSHCSGHALDVAVRWLEAVDGADALRAVLTQRCESGQVNLIDEGQAWHLCVAPGAMAGLRAEYDALVGPGR